MTEHQSFSGKFWHDKNGNFVVWQSPNWALWIWITAKVISMFLPHGNIEQFISYVGDGALFVWAVMELGWGVNYFRRLLGLCVILMGLAVRFL
ncbi:hypothetical protein COY17_01530 [Candidatus Saccharibacteria bacterium CG_4_10_14_0_2_um_filter_52_9]|nr:MAG: hypothetical protein COY17_01530 [Candidatus Saccharibacteria bacterium CG_4_10_14_0_2_um_filter_52_9]